MKNMTDIIEKDAIAIMENVEHKAVIDKLLELLKNSKKITNHTKLRELILERENIISTGIGVGLYPSKAFLEGDAVIAETELTNAGRGRNADFMMYLRAAYLNGDYRDWDKWNFGSFDSTIDF